MPLLTCFLRTARLLVCMGDCGRTPFEGGSPSNPQANVWKQKKFTAKTEKCLKQTEISKGNGEKKGIPWSQAVRYHNDKQMVFWGWIPFVVPFVMQHCDQRNINLLPLELEL